MIFLAILILFALIFGFCYYENNKIDVSYYNIKSKDATKNFKIVHLSDFHSKPFKKVLEKTQNKDKMLEYARQLIKIAPVYYITGNHERRLDNFNELMKELQAAGFNVLLNECIENDYCTILGLDENQADFSDYKARKNGTFIYKDMSKYFEELEKSDKFKLVLSHFPENFEGIKELNYSQYDFDLQLSGHAHGGQWIMPFIGPLFSPGQGVLPKYARGTFGERPKLIVSRGLGNSEFPLRLFNHPEIIVVNIEQNKG